MDVVLLLGALWAAILVPPAVRAHAARKEAFLLSFGVAPVALYSPPRPPSPPIRRRRRIAGGLLVAMAVTLAVGLLPTFRPLLFVHLFLVDAFLAYIGVLAYNADRAARRRTRPAAAAVTPKLAPSRVRTTPSWRRAPVRGPSVVSQGAAT